MQLLASLARPYNSVNCMTLADVEVSAKYNALIALRQKYAGCMQLSIKLVKDCCRLKVDKLAIKISLDKLWVILGLQVFNESWVKIWVIF